ncbi:unnamed protein product [Paramecium sonneborni]|uniref:Uncharacterized protein n=1 Tax=Paramecium sonneborni TaxID=65129 RepID=A0A8S1MC46_9CILI|nr:unnamed protein product [Paramecium sonneborni]
MLKTHNIQNGVQCHHQNICGWKRQRTTYQINQIENEFSIYIQNGRVMQLEQIPHQLSNNETDTNLELVKHLTQKREVNQNNGKIGQLMMFWKQQRIKAGGFYNDNEQKLGRWIELSNNFWEKSQIFIEGQYEEGKKQGRWNIINLEKKIGGGNYDENGLKNGKWKEQHNNFYDLCEVYFVGEYKLGQRIGFWNIINRYKQMYYDRIIDSGGGIYNENGLKHGKWIETHEYFFNFCQVLYVGQYENGRKYGRWDTLHLKLGSIQYEVIGGGNYDDFELKNGMWRELHQNFQEFSVVVYEGLYQDNLKIGQWQIQYRKYGEEDIEIIGSGYYEEDKKVGVWKEQATNFWDESLIYHAGEYYKGKKIGKWNIIYKNYLIGGGQYNYEGQKHGNWIDVDENYSLSKSILYQGVYQNGNKVGIWFTIDDISEGFTQYMALGFYNYEGMKNGRWLDLVENYRENSQVMQKGNYKNGIMYGKWNFVYKHHNSLNFHELGGGQYDENGKRDGPWLELVDNFQENCQVILVGEYKNGYKQGKWNALFRPLNEYTYQTLGGGEYRENGFKNGKWTEIHENFSNFWRQTNIFEYQNGCKLKQIA